MVDPTQPEDMVKLAEHQAGVADVMAVYQRASDVMAQAAPYFRALQPRLVSFSTSGTVPVQ